AAASDRDEEPGLRRMRDVEEVGRGRRRLLAPRRSVRRAEDRAAGADRDETADTSGDAFERSAAGVARSPVLAVRRGKDSPAVADRDESPRLECDRAERGPA